MKNMKLLEVHCYYQDGDNINFVEEKSWKGKVILREDLTFEGIVVDLCSNITSDRLISGTLVDYNGASLMKFTNSNFCPCSFFGLSTGKEIIGTWAIHNYDITLDMGNCKIIFTEIPMDESELSNILQRVKTFKSNMDDFSQELYKSLIENMNITVAEFIKNMNDNKEKLERRLGSTLNKLEF